MKRNAKALLALAAGCLLSVAASGEDASRGDDRVRKALDAEGIKYTVYESGSFGVVFDVSEERSHEVTVVSATETYRSLELREIWAVAMDLPPGEPDPATAADLLARNASTKVGSWAVERDGDDWFVLYTIKVPASLSPEQLVDLVYFAAEICDELEEEYTGEDAY